MDDIYKLVGKRVRAERLSANLTMEALAERAGISPGFIAHIERGQKFPTIRTIERIAQALNLDISELISEPTLPEKLNPAITKILRLLKEKSARQQNLILELVKTASRLCD